MQKPTCAVNDCTMPVRARGWCQRHYSRWNTTGSVVPAPPFPSVEDRFWAKVKKTPTCWEWQGAFRSSYGVVRAKRDAEGIQKSIRAHRFAYELLVGPIPDGMMLDHMCHNPACVNPAHLRPVTNKQNMENLSGPHADSTSGYRGVAWKSREQKWLVAVGHNGKHYHGGYFTDRHEAAEVARRMRQELFTHSDADLST